MPGSKLYPILGVRTAQVFTVSLSWVRPKANGGRPGHVSHPLELPPVSTRSLTCCILPVENLWPQLACRERLHGEQACAEVLGRQAPLAVEPAQKILGRKVLLPRVAIQAAGDQVAGRVASRLRDRHHMIQAVGPAGGPAQTVKAHASFARVDGLA